ncbi:hypothetical protein K493DRAFT_405779 [Basidiobolus meristosporus CBS 931.73]|uniref:Uncharacterized protein n=1 Tax=Basidiobolus meristosporus CBS 931.73 TaxID=1314790 RepID=A0A1Y1YRX8_9FUNG|nr:hypothetical protein K493DRAFT_405779 [Basidiobolus meristosporus CBS 931.73]|eukprot:ORY00790.1 hypothetical protein K493DRAFT_405779 [Basidiobolus meristosporus CBS 931.73]
MFEYELDADSGKKLLPQLTRMKNSLSAEDLDKVETRQRREPQPKLDANRLLQPNGLMLIKEKGPKLKFKGKGQEVSKGITEVQIQLDNNRPEALTDWCFGDNDENISNQLGVDQLRRIRENRERALVRLAARKRSRAMESEEREEVTHKCQQIDEVIDNEEMEQHNHE